MVSQRLINSMVILVLFATSMTLLASFNSAFSSTQQWQDAGKQVPNKLILRIIQDDLHPGIPVDVGRMKIWKIKLSQQDRPLYLVDSRITDLAERPRANPLCGASGCAFFIYELTDSQSFQPIWSNYLNVNLPPTVPLFEPVNDLRNGLPVLKINQMESKRIRQSNITFNGKVYEVTQTTLLPQIYE
jgi:hypothetical protein